MKQQELHDDSFSNLSYYREREVYHAAKRQELIQNMTPVADSSQAWVVSYLEQSVSDEYYELARKLSDELDLSLAHKSREQAEAIREKAFADLVEQTGGRKIKKMQQAAFYNQELAQMVADSMDDSEGPELIPIDQVTVPVDKFKEEVLDGKRPYTVLMLDGYVFEVWGYGSHWAGAYRISEIQYSIGEEIQMEGTFWAWDHFLAVEEAEKAWKQLESEEKFIRKEF